MASRPIDLRKLGYKVDMTSDHEPGQRADLWNVAIRCKQGTIYPHGGKRLQAMSTERGKPGFLRDKLLAIPGVELWQDADNAVSVVFDASLLDEVAKVMGARKKGIATPEQIERLKRIRPTKRGG